MPDSFDPLVRHLSKRVHEMTDLDQTQSECLQLANYGIGGHYEPHFDMATVGLIDLIRLIDLI